MVNERNNIVLPRMDLLRGIKEENRADIYNRILLRQNDSVKLKIKRDEENQGGWKKARVIEIRPYFTVFRVEELYNTCFLNSDICYSHIQIEKA
jgi:hypothetical protein